jgi:hypothetical protein
LNVRGVDGVVADIDAGGDGTALMRLLQPKLTMQLLESFSFEFLIVR